MGIWDRGQPVEIPQGVQAGGTFFLSDDGTTTTTKEQAEGTVTAVTVLPDKMSGQTMIHQWKTVPHEDWAGGGVAHVR
eukprot:SAG11_NODE_9837_length_877_cov_0.903599_3_plen_77_part_01